jgi:hypothetical protein
MAPPWPPWRSWRTRPDRAGTLQEVPDDRDAPRAGDLVLEVVHRGW